MTYTIEQDPTSLTYQVWGSDPESPALLGGYTTRREAAQAAQMEFPELVHVEMGRGTGRWFIVEIDDGFYLGGVSFPTREAVEDFLMLQEVAA